MGIHQTSRSPAKARHTTTATAGRALPAGVALLLAASLAACVVYPVVVPQDRHDDCPLVTRELTLDTAELVRVNGADCRGRADDCLAGLVLGTALMASSTLVSGSIVLVGNTLHWLERSQRCPAVRPAPSPTQSQAALAAQQRAQPAPASRPVPARAAASAADAGPVTVSAPAAPVPRPRAASEPLQWGDPPRP